MAKLVRVTVSLDSDLLEEFNHCPVVRTSANRSEAIRQLMQGAMMTRSDGPEACHVATLTLIYGRRCADLARRLAALQHDRRDLIVSTTRMALEPDLYLEVLILRGRADELSDLASLLCDARGILHGELVVATADGMSRSLLAPPDSQA